MPRAPANGIELEYEVQGPEDGAALLLIMGIGQQMVAWPPELLDALEQEGLRTIRFDTRDTGLSTHFDHVAAPGLLEILTQTKSGARDVPYRLEDLADDAVGLLDHLGINRAHVLGVSMGGMVAQIVAARHADRTATLTSIMSTTSEGHLPPPTAEALGVLLQRPAGSDKASVVAHGVNARRALSGPKYPTSDEYWAEMTALAYDRDVSPKGFARHLLAVTVSGNRRQLLPTITAPTLVIHGSDDPLVHVDCGRRTAELIPGARLEIIEGMGHDLAPSLCPELARMIAAHASAHPI